MLIISVCLKNWDVKSVKGEIELFSTMWSTKGNFGKGKKMNLEMKSAPSQDRSFSCSITPVSINLQQTASSLRAPDEWWEMTNIDRDIKSSLLKSL